MDDKVDGDAGALHEDETSEETNEGDVIHFFPDNNNVLTPENSMSVNYDEDSTFNQPSSESIDASSESSSKLWESSGSQRRFVVFSVSIILGTFIYFDFLATVCINCSYQLLFFAEL